ncbi:MAG: hypothetical protein K2O35_00920 [Clostridia bacterium]|nr:hypothetical protein [Clostridia bacterium]
MAKRSKKKNPNVLSEQQKADIRHNQELDLKKDRLDKKLNITVGIVIAIAVIAFLLLPALNLNFSGSLSEFLGDLVTEENDQEMGVTLDMTYLDFLFAMTKGYKDSIEYIANSNASGIGASIVESAFRSKVTQEDVEMLDGAYMASFVISILLFVSLIVLVVITAIKRSKKADGVSFLTAVIIFCALAIAQWIFFVAVGAASAGRAQIQPNIASYLLLAAAVTLRSVYGVYRNKVKKLNGQRKPVGEIQRVKDER